MKTVRMGRTGIRVSQLCLGTMTFGWSEDEAESFAIMDAAFEAGINFFDTADIYSRWVEGNPGGVSETIIGKWLKGRNRRDIVLATKVRGRMWDGPNGEGLSRHHIILAAEDSLRRLDTDYIDLYQIHWYDAETPIEETLYALDHLVQSGKVVYAGCSNMPAWRLMKSLWASDVHRLVRFETIQPHYSLYHRAEFERELADVCVDQQIGIIPYSPLAAGFATGKYTRDARQAEGSARDNSSLIQRLTSKEEAFDALDVQRSIAEAHGVPMGQVALAWLLTRPAMTAPIIGARNIQQLEESLGAVDLVLSAEEIERLNEATEGF